MAMSNAALEAALKAALQRLVAALANKTAPDSLKLEGKTLAEITTQILAGQAASAAEADNALALGGKDLATIEAERAAALTAAIDALRTELEGSIGGVTKESIGLGNVVNYGVATEEEALAGAADKYVTAFLADKIAQAKIDELVGASPETLNTIHEIAAALNNDPDVINSMMTLIGTKETPEGAQAKADAARDAAIVAAGTETDAKIAAAVSASEEATDGKIAAVSTRVTAIEDNYVREGVTDISLNPVTVGEEGSGNLGVVLGALASGIADAHTRITEVHQRINTEHDALAAADRNIQADLNAYRANTNATIQTLQDADSALDGRVSALEATGQTLTGTLDQNTVAVDVEGTPTQTLLTDVLAALQANIDSVAAGGSADLAALQTAFNAFVAAKATDTDMLTGTDDTKYTTARAVNYAIEAAIAALVGTAPEALDTIQKLAAALQNNPEALTALQTMVGQNADRITALEAKVTSDTATVLADAKAYTDAEVAALEAVVDTKLDKTAQAVDSAKLEGQSLADINTARDAAIAAAVAPVASDLEALVIELTNAFDQAAAELEGTPAV